ncbi:MAG: ATP-binding cassette domain-containing protein, partial [Clostridium sp.]|nr:ATP-binding cassette domain-containing protein [Clostridium sp.]
MGCMIEVRDVSKTFQDKDRTVQALNHINICIEEGDIYGIIGMSGAGKSTLVRCLNFLEVPTEGSVIVDGQELGTLSDRELRRIRGSIGMIFQSFNLLMQKTVLENVLFPLKIQGRGKAESLERARDLLKTVGLADKEKAYPSQLSGGQRQRVAIARAIASDPKILLCDEATSALDPQTTNSILQLLKKINQEMGITIVIITHQMSVVREICHNVAIVEHGSIVEDGSVEEIFTHPKSRAARELVFEGSETSETFAGRNAADRTLKELR